MEWIKHEKLVVKALPDKLKCSNALNLIVAEDVSKHNIAADWQQWQNGIKTFSDVLEKNDMKSPFFIPTEFAVDDPTKTKEPFIDLTKDFHFVTDERVREWECYIKAYAAEVDIKSCD